MKENRQANEKLDADTLIDAREKLLADIMNLEDGNTYKEKIIKLLEQTKKNKLSNIEIYLLINDVLTDYDFNVVIPKEKMEIEEKRKSELENSISAIPIYNPDDVTEVAIKTRTAIGQVFEDGYNELVRLIGVDNLNMKNRQGELITDFKKVSKGKRKIEAQEIMKQYADFIARPDLKRYAIQQIDIFEIPHYMEKEDGRGKKGFYMEYLAPIMIFYLMQRGEKIIYTTVEELSCFVGLVTRHYKKISLTKLAKINPHITNSMLNQFYYRCKPELESVIFRVLDSLQDEYKVLNYYKNYRIYTSDGNSYTSLKNEDVIIRQTERKVLKEFHVKRMLTIFQRNQQKSFYNRVCELINETYSLNWCGYKKQIQIFTDNEALQEMMYDFTDNEISQNKKAIASRFATRIANRTKSDYKNTNAKAEKTKSEWIQEQMERPEFAELIQIGFDYESDFREMVKELHKELGIYKYHDNYLDIQTDLIRFMIGEPEMKLEEYIPELSELL